MISSRETKRWVIPKGWPMEAMRNADAAAREAYEEAGIKGIRSSRRLGEYTYWKRLEDLREIECRVEVYPLRFTEQLGEWPEKGERVVRWFHPSEAARLVQEEDLAELILGFGAGLYMRFA